MQAKESLTENISILFQKHPSIGVLIKRLSENMQQFYRRTPMSKCDFNKVAKQLCSLVNLQHIFRAPFPKNTPGVRRLFSVNKVRKRFGRHLLENHRWSTLVRANFDCQCKPPKILLRFAKFMSGSIQKQPSRGVLRKRCFPSLLKSHFGMGVLL